MFTLKIYSDEMYDEKNNVFIPASVKKTFHLEHSLFSISKWESLYHKAFLSFNEMDVNDTINYIRCMSQETITDDDMRFIKNKDIIDIQAYIDDPMSAYFKSLKQSSSFSKKSNVCSEEIYAAMVSYRIPFECEHWHLNRLLSLINVLNNEHKKANGKPMSEKDTISEYQRINEMRKAKYNTKG